MKLKNLPKKALFIFFSHPSICNVDESHDGGKKNHDLASNLTALYQPSDQGVIANLKKRHCHNLLSHILVAVEGYLNEHHWMGFRGMEWIKSYCVGSWRKSLDNERKEFPEKHDKEDSGQVSLMKQVPGLKCK